MTEGQEHHAPFVEIKRGQEKDIPYKNDGKPSRIVIGRNPSTESVRTEEKKNDDLRIKLVGADKLISRRAAILDIFTKAVIIKNIGQKEIQYRTGPQNIWQKVSPRTYARLNNSVEDMINFELQIGQFTSRSGKVGGKEKVLKSLILN